MYLFTCLFVWFSFSLFPTSLSGQVHVVRAPYDRAAAIDALWGTSFLPNPKLVILLLLFLFSCIVTCVDGCVVDDDDDDDDHDDNNDDADDYLCDDDYHDYNFS